MSQVLVLNPINLNNDRNSITASSDENGSLRGKAKEYENLLKNDENNPNYFRIDERAAIRLFFLRCCIFFPVPFDLTFMRYRSFPAAFCIYLQLIISTLLFVYNKLSQDDQIDGLIDMPSCSHANRQSNIADDTLYIPYLIVSLLTVSRFQHPLWLFAAAPLAIIFLIFYSVQEIPHCIELVSAQPMVLLPLINFRFLRVNLTIGIYGFFRWLFTFVVTFEFIRLGLLYLLDIIFRGVRPNCRIEVGAKIDTINSNVVDSDPTNDIEMDNPHISFRQFLEKLLENLIPNFMSCISKSQSIIIFTLTIFSRVSEIPIRHTIAVAITCMSLLFIASSITGWCETIKKLVASELYNFPYINDIKDVLTYIPIGAWILSGFFWIVNIHSIYAVSEQSRHLRLRYSKVKEGISTAGIDPILDDQLAPQLLKFDMTHASSYIVAHLLCNLIAYALAFIIFIPIIVFKITIIGLTTLLVSFGALFTLPVILKNLRRCVGQCLIMCLDTCCNIGINFFLDSCGTTGKSIKEILRRFTAISYCVYNCSMDGTHMLVPRCFMAADCLITLVTSPFIGAFNAITRCVYGSLWGIISLSQLHSPILPSFLASYDIPYQYYGGMMRSSHQELIDEENDIIPSIERKEEWQ